ncbi:MAG: amidase [Hyphomonadaceae bacterium]|nr:amidase [Hyphomonadaceae bacterium]
MRMTRRGLMATISASSLAACAPKTDAPAAAAAAAGGGELPDATQIASMIRNKEITAAEAVEEAIKRADKIQPQINFMVSDTYALARTRAQTALTGPFAGVPYLIKDLNSVIGAKTRQGSRSTESLPVATEQDAYINASFATGIVCIGKSATPENGYLPTTEPLAFGPTRNPWNTEHSTGGSSGGSAAAVAAGVVPMAHANDGGGSIRFPAANCGLVGLKPSRGRMIYEELKPGPLDIAVQGVVSRTVRDTAGFFAATEFNTAGSMFPPVGMVTTPGTKKLRVGVITKGFSGAEASPDVAAAVNATAKLLEGAGHTVSLTNWPTAPTFGDDFLSFWSLGAAQDMKLVAEITGKPADETTAEPFSLRMAQNAALLKPEDIEGVQKRLMEATAAYNTWMAGFDVVVSPVFTSPPSPLGFLRGDVPFDELRQRLLHEVGYTLIHNVAGAPAMSLPLGWSQTGLPIGIQFCAAGGAEKTLLELAYELEAAQPWIGKRPPVWAG